MQIKNRQQVLLVAAIALIGIFAAERLVLSPLTKLWKSRHTRITELKTQIAQGESLIARDDSIRRRWNQLRSAALAPNASTAEQQLFRAADRWASASRVSITAITPRWKEEDNDYMTYQCRIDASGNLNSLSRFLYEFEKEPLALKLESLDIGSRDKDGKQLTMGLLVSALVLNPVSK